MNLVPGFKDAVQGACTALGSATHRAPPQSPRWHHAQCLVAWPAPRPPFFASLGKQHLEMIENIWSGNLFCFKSFFVLNPHPRV